MSNADSPIPTRIADKVTEFNEGFNAEIGADATRVFDDEQSGLRDSGVPAAAVRVGDTIVDATLVTTAGDEVSLSETVGQDVPSLDEVREELERRVGSLLELMGLDLPVPDHSTLSRRGPGCRVPG